MPGPLPKNPALKQGKSKQSTRALLPAETQPIVRAPQLEPHPGGEKWHALVLKFWDDVWCSPMAGEYMQADVHGLFRMAVLMQRWLASPTVQISAELRQLSMQFGLSPIDRRRLQWTVARSTEAVEQVERTRSKRGRVVEHDPREVLS